MNIYFVPITCIFMLVNLFSNSISEGEYCHVNNNQCTSVKRRYILYDVNPPEGFNLRRDVYLRMAVFVHNLKQFQNFNEWVLVLPPWPNLYHWQSKDIVNQRQLPWGLFFDIKSLQKFAPVIEMYQFFKEMSPANHVIIDEVYTLQHVKDMFETGNFEETLKIESCHKNYVTSYFGYNNISANNVFCLSFHGHASMLRSIIEKTDARIILFNHAEIPLHDVYGNAIYWQGRRSMRFNKELKQIADDYRLNFLNSTDSWDNTELPEDWTLEQPKHTARGGNYLCAHIRRKDFIWGRPEDVPNLSNTATQIVSLLLKLKLNRVFIATDSTPEEFGELKSLLSDHEVFKYEPGMSVKQQFKDGGIAIIEQSICSHASYFIGTHESTFSFRIQEEREIIGFPSETTFNRFCGDVNIATCSKPSLWRITF